MKNLIPLDQLGFGWRSHKSAMWWLWLIYARPREFHQAFVNFSSISGFGTVIRLLLQALPYIIALTALCQFIVFDLLNFPVRKSYLSPSRGLLNILPIGMWLGIIIGGILGIVIAFLTKSELSLLLKVISQTILGITFGIIGGVIFVIEVSPASLIIFGVGLGCSVGILIGILTEFFDEENKLSYDLAGGAILGLVMIGVTSRTNELSRVYLAGLITSITAAFFSLRLYYYPFHLALVWPKPRASLYDYHPVAWDMLCSIPFLGLHRLLITLSESMPKKGDSEIERLATEYPSQRLQALYARTILLARKSALISDLSRLDSVLAQLPSGAIKFLSQTGQLREWVAEIVYLQVRLSTTTRPSFREPAAEILCKEIENFRHRIAGFYLPLASEFRLAALEWEKIAEHQLAEARRATSKEPLKSIFQAGAPIDCYQEAFVRRFSIIEELEQEISSSNGCPGLILYGQRRTGKSTILRNLTGFLSQHTLMSFVSMQSPELFLSKKSFVRSIIGEIQKTLPNLSNPYGPSATLSSLFKFLTACNQHLESEGKRILLAVDEYEMIDVKIGRDVLPLDLLNTIRESIQTHRRITWIFAGSHEIYELTNAPWTSYLVSARTIEVPAFTEAETRLLLTEPMKHSSLWRNNEEKRPRFADSFWGEGGIERIHSEAGGWPHLVQLIAERIVDLVNEEEVSQVTPDLFQRALDKSIVRGQNVLYELMRRESTLPGEWEYLLAFKKAETQAPPQDEKIAASLRRRLLIAEENGEWRLRVPLMARWLKQRGQ